MAESVTPPPSIIPTEVTALILLSLPPPLDASESESATVASPSFIGRATRGYYGVDLDEKCPSFMKDAWRINFKGIPKESETYRRLAAYGVDQYLPDFYFGGDVPVDSPPIDCDDVEDWDQRNSVTTSQESATYRYIDEQAIKRPRSDKTGKDPAFIEVYPHVHHRMLFKKIGVPLRKFRSTKQLCRALYHALLCHSAALDNAKILHRDLSGGNILIDKDGNGFLSDWDLCRYTDEALNRRRKGRTGTWEYMSVPLAMGWVNYVHGRRDDVESVAHLLFYHAGIKLAYYRRCAKCTRTARQMRPVGLELGGESAAS